MAWGFLGKRSKKDSVAAGPPVIMDCVSPESQDSSECMKGNLVRNSRFTMKNNVRYMNTLYFFIASNNLSMGILYNKQSLKKAPG